MLSDIQLKMHEIVTYCFELRFVRPLLISRVAAASRLDSPYRFRFERLRWLRWSGGRADGGCQAATATATATSTARKDQTLSTLFKLLNISYRFLHFPVAVQQIFSTSPSLAALFAERNRMIFNLKSRFMTD